MCLKFLKNSFFSRLFPQNSIQKKKMQIFLLYLGISNYMHSTTKINLDLFFSCSLEELGPENEPDNVVLAFQQLAEEFGEQFRKQYDYDI